MYHSIGWDSFICSSIVILCHIILEMSQLLLCCLDLFIAHKSNKWSTTYKLQVRRNAVVHTTANDHNGIICLLKCIMSYTSDAAEHRQIDRWLDGHKQTQSIRGPVQYSQNQQSILSVNSTKVWVIKPLEGAVQTSHGLFIDHAC